MKYNAFISYSHSQDVNLAPALERGLEKFAKPAFKRRALRIFRDGNDLSISPDLWGKIEEGLSQSEYVVYCASSASARSHYCNKEVEYWLNHKSMDKFLLVITEGELAWDFEKNDFDWERTTAVPKLLSGAFKNEPLYVDFRGEVPKENLNLDNADFKSKLVYIAATLHKKPVGDMVGEGIKQHKRTLRIRNTALTVVFSLMALALVLMFSSIQRRIASELHFQAKALENEDPSIALRVEAAALDKYDFSEFRNSALSIIANNNFYKILEKSDTTYVADFAISPRDSLIYAAYSDGNVGVLNFQGEKVRVFKAHEGKVNSIALAPDGLYLQTTSDDYSTRLWTTEGNIVEDVTLDLENVNDAIFTPNHAHLITAFSDGKIRVYNMQGEIVTEMDGHEFGVEELSISEDGSTLLATTSGANSTSMHLWDMEGYRIAQWNIPWLSATALSPDGQTIIAGKTDGQTIVLSNRGDTLHLYQGQPATVTSTSFSKDGETFLAGYANGIAEEWNLEGKKQKEFKGHKQSISAIRYSADGNTVVTSSFDGTLRSWALDRVEKGAVQQFTGPERWVEEVAMSNDGNYVFASDENGTGYIWDKDSQLVKTLEDTEFKIRLARFTEDSKSLVAVSQTGAEIRIYDMNFGEPRVIKKELMLYRPVAISPDGSYVFLSAVVTGGILWNLKSNTTTAYDGVTIASAAFSPNSDALLIGTKEGKARMYDLQGKLKKEYDAHGYMFTSNAYYMVESVAFSPDGQTIAMGSADDGNIRIASIKGRVLAEFQGHEDTVSSLAFANDGNSLLSVSHDKTAKLWDLRGTLLSDFSRQTGEVSSLAFSPDDEAVLVGSTDGRVQLIQFIEVEQFLNDYVQPLNREQRVLFDLD